VAALVAGLAVAQAAGGYALPVGVVTGGGGASTGGSYSLTASLGQAVAGTSSGGNYVVVAGYPGGSTTFHVYVPVVFNLSPG
jgi:hypothetical protein